MKKIKKESAVRNILYALKIITQCAPGHIFCRILTQTAYWFFTGFVKEILFLKLLLDLITGGGSFTQYVVLIIIFVLCELLATGTNCLCDYFVGVHRKKFYKNLNDRIFRKALEVDIAFYENPDFYDKYKRATEIITDERFDEFAYYFSSFIAGGLTGLFLTMYIVSIDPRILLILLFALPVLVFEVIKGKVQVKKDKEMTPHKRSKAYVKRILYMKEYAKDMRTSDIFGVLHERYRSSVEKNRAIIKKYGIKIMLLETLSGLFGKAVPVASSYIYAAYRFIIKKDLAVSDFSVIMTAMSNLKDVFNDLGEAFSNVRTCAEYFGNLRDFMECENTVCGGTLEAGELQSLEFRDVTFTYDGADKPTLNKLNFTVTKGQTVAVVGINGAGKTTFTKLLFRFYDPDSGVILYNGKDIREYSIDSLRRRLSSVFQDHKVFALSIAENVLCREAIYPDDTSLAVSSLEKADVYQKTLSLPEGINTVLTREFDEKGTGLSGGEQQKIAAARMFARQYDLAVLDEPSSALDPVAEYKMYESLISATRDKTVIFISHRLASAVLSDIIYVFENGTVIQKGTHEQLMSSKGVYSEMFTLQASAYSQDERGSE